METKKRDKKTSYQKKRMAGKDLYIMGVSLTDIAEILDVANNTVGKWAKKEDWADEKVKYLSYKDDMTETVKRLALYQAKTLEKIVEQYEENDELILISNKDSQTLNNFYRNVKDDFLAYRDYIAITREFVAWVFERNPELGAEIKKENNVFLDEKRKIYKSY